jgi:hypothetical protein
MPGEVLLVIDFKEKIRLCRRARETGDVFFNRPLRTLFSIYAYYRPNLNAPLATHVGNFISDDLSHDGQFVVQALPYFLESAWFKSLKVPVHTIRLWSDNGPHFRTYQYLANIYALQKKFNMNFFVEFFAENHGKSAVDSWFSVVSRALEDHTKRFGKEMASTDQLIALLQDAFAEMQANGSKWTQEIFKFTRDRTASLITLDVSKCGGFISSTYRHRFSNGKVLSQVENEQPQDHQVVIIPKKGTRKSHRLGFVDQAVSASPKRPHLEGVYMKHKKQRTMRGEVPDVDERSVTAAALLLLSNE